MGMATRRLAPLTRTVSTLARRLAWPGTLSIGVMTFVACGGSSGDDSSPSGGSDGTQGLAGSSNGTTNPSAGVSGSSGGNQAIGGKSSTGGQAGLAGGGSGGMATGGDSAKPGDPKGPKGGMAGAAGGGGTTGGGGTAGTGGANAACPALAPVDKAVCTTEAKCEYPDLTCNCAGMEQARTWHCKAPKSTSTCPAMPPKDGSACTLKAGDPAPAPCHYEMTAVDCSCTASQWACVAAP